MNQELSLEELFEAQGKRRWEIAKTTAKERIAKLQKLRNALAARQQEFYGAVWEDFHKPKTEAHLCEVYPALSEIDCAVAHLDVSGSELKAPETDGEAVSALLLTLSE